MIVMLVSPVTPRGPHPSIMFSMRDSPTGVSTALSKANIPSAEISKVRVTVCDVATGGGGGGGTTGVATAAGGGGGEGGGGCGAGGALTAAGSVMAGAAPNGITTPTFSTQSPKEF